MAGRTWIPLTLSAVAIALLATPPALGAGGCSENKCVPRTGTWSAPWPQKLSDGDSPPLSFKVKYMRNGKTVKSKYGNTIPSFQVNGLRYSCDDNDNPNEGSGVETVVSAPTPITIDRDGKVKTKFTPPDDPWVSAREHKLSMTFKREKFSGRFSGRVVNLYSGDVCSFSVNFSGKRK